MSDTQLQAGQYQLISVYLRNYTRQSNVEISNLIVGFTINESMSAPFMYGKTTVFDGSDIMSTLPVIGEEFIEFTYVDFFGKTRVDEFMVYSVSDVRYPQESNPTLLQYTLNFVSIPRVLTDGYRIMKGYRDGKVSDYAQLVYNEYFKDQLERRNLKSKSFVVQPTDNNQHLVVPNFTPVETMLFFARHAFNNDSYTQTFRFFENRDKYFLATNEYVRDYYGNLSTGTQNYLNQASGLNLPDAHVFNYNYLPDISPESQQMQMFNLLNIDFGEKVNTINDIKYGAYKKKICQIDLLNGTAQIIPTYSIQQDFSRNNKNEKLAHSQGFVNDAIPDKYIRYIIKDYSVGGEPTGPEIKPDMKYSDLYDRKSSYLYHYKQNSVDVTIYGRNNIVAGSVINLQLPIRKVASQNSASEIDTERSGYYIADSVQNLFNNKTYTQKITLSRYGIGTK